MDHRTSTRSASKSQLLACGWSVTPASFSFCMQKFTVLLLYPDYLSSDFGHETFMTTVEAPDPDHAVVTARKEAREANRNQCEGEDFYCLCVIAGEHNDIKP